jgi:4-amino-4-deoxy-L-arabinose transferase-like glycosyltransferase
MMVPGDRAWLQRAGALMEDGIRVRRSTEKEIAPGSVPPRTVRRFEWRTVAVALVFCLYFFRLNGTGLLSTDEPRYAAIGRQMAISDDWITPRLWGEAWFEKPPLLYWMTGAGFRLGLDEEFAPRLPVALLSVMFLIFFFWTLRREFGDRPALFATAILGTSAGWLAFSYVAVPDLPMSAFFAAAMLLGMTWLRTERQSWLVASAIALGLAVLAKGLAPLALAIPFAWAGRRKLRAMLKPAPVLAFLAVAAPWYALCYARNGRVFLDKFFWEHHVGRFLSPALQHTQPAWYFLPIFAAALFPWTPALALLFRRAIYGDERRRLLLLWLVFGLVFFSLSTNKLPGYILPLLPAAAALMGLALSETGERWVLAASVALLCLTGPVAAALPHVVAEGLSKSQLAPWSWTWLLPLALVPIVWYLPRAGGVVVVVVALTGSVVYLKSYALPVLDHLASARSLRDRILPMRNSVCIDQIPRGLRYSLNYYTVTPLPDCSEKSLPVRLRVWGH